MSGRWSMSSLRRWDWLGFQRPRTVLGTPRFARAVVSSPRDISQSARINHRVSTEGPELNHIPMAFTSCLLGECRCSNTSAASCRLGWTSTMCREEHSLYKEIQQGAEPVHVPSHFTAPLHQREIGRPKPASTPSRGHLLLGAPRTPIPHPSPRFVSFWPAASSSHKERVHSEHPMERCGSLRASHNWPQSKTLWRAVVVLVSALRFMPGTDSNRLEAVRSSPALAFSLSLRVPSPILLIGRVLNLFP
jgi:hypothetical protein